MSTVMASLSFRDRQISEKQASCAEEDKVRLHGVNLSMFEHNLNLPNSKFSYSKLGSNIVTNIKIVQTSFAYQTTSAEVGEHSQ